MNSQRAGALFIMPSVVTGQSLIISSWFNVAGWAAGARAVVGNAWIVTPEGLVDPDEARRRASSPTPAASTKDSSWRSRLPLTFRTAYKDLRQAVRAARFRSAALDGPWTASELAFVWQRHDLFHTVGLHTARVLDRPLVLFVDAPVVWEHQRWGVLRPPGWGRAVEAVGENRQFRTADLVACVSNEVADEIHRRGVPRNRLLVTPNGVDLAAFSAQADGNNVRRKYGLEGKRVVGWVGTFRAFHGLEIAVEAVRALQEQVPDVTVLFVGDGAERPTIERLCHSAGLRHAVFTGAIPYHAMASYLSAMDVGLVLAGHTDQFHYSPLKLREYMACGIPVVAPRVGEMARTLKDGRDALLVEPRDSWSLADAIGRLLTDIDLAREIGANGRRRMEAEGSWEHQVRRVLHALDGLGLSHQPW